MFRAIFAVIVGYIVSAVWVMVGLTVAWKVLGSSFAHEQETLEVTVAWCILALGLGFVGAILAGFVTAVIAPSPRRTPVKVLAGIMLVLGLAFAVMHLFVDDPTAEPAKPVQDMTAFEAASESIAPTWYNFAIPIAGCIGVLVGGSLRARPTSAAPPSGDV